ncbi:MAG: hypothetical protein LBI69_02600 [Puniceicoccales bacterium]|jgi:hypothetical protein|nr:hypothetical protein [Puniceicoccales bacterium]
MEGENILNNENISLSGMQNVVNANFDLSANNECNPCSVSELLFSEFIPKISGKSASSNFRFFLWATSVVFDVAILVVRLISLVCHPAAAAMVAFILSMHIAVGIAVSVGILLVISAVVAAIITVARHYYLTRKASYANGSKALELFQLQTKLTSLNKESSALKMRLEKIQSHDSWARIDEEVKGEIVEFGKSIDQLNVTINDDVKPSLRDRRSGWEALLFQSVEEGGNVGGKISNN